MAVIHIFLKDFGDLYYVSIYALRYQQDNKNEVHLHQDILERRLLPGSETSGKTADHGDPHFRRFPGNRTGNGITGTGYHPSSGIRYTGQTSLSNLFFILSKGYLALSSILFFLLSSARIILLNE